MSSYPVFIVVIGAAGAAGQQQAGQGVWPPLVVAGPAAGSQVTPLSIPLFLVIGAAGQQQSPLLFPTFPTFPTYPLLYGGGR